MTTEFLLFYLLPTIFLVIIASQYLRLGKDQRWKNAKGLNNIPPGTMGWPFFGETFAFMKTHSCTSLGHYLEDRKRRYGKIFKSNIFGNPTIISLDAEFNRFVVMNDGKLFEPCLPKSVTEILGEKTMVAITGEVHRYMKSIVLTFLGMARLQNHFIGDAERFVIETLSSWKENTPFPAKEEACKVTFNLIVKNILSLNPGEPETEELRKLYQTIMKGATAMPLNLPGTPLRNALQSRATILKRIERLMKERIRKIEIGIDEIGEADLLGQVLKHSNVTAEQFGDLLLGLLFGGHDTSTTTMTLAIYFLHDCPKAIDQLREEHLQIIKMKRQRGEPKALTWDDYKQMKFTQCVVSETLRLGNIIRFLPRKASTYVQYKGYDIPREWSVILVIAAPHLDPSLYKNPQKFDPWRWQDPSINTVRIESYMPFSQGIRNCAGLELAKMEISVFIHHLVVNFDWEPAEPDHPLAYAFPEFPKGLPIKVRRLSLVE